MATRLALIQWEDLFVSTLDLEAVRCPRKNVDEYRPGEYIEAKYQGKTYKAIISEISSARQEMEKLKKEFKQGNKSKLKFPYNDEKASTSLGAQVTKPSEVNANKETSQTKRPRKRILPAIDAEEVNEKLYISDESDAEGQQSKKKKQSSSKVASVTDEAKLAAADKNKEKRLVNLQRKKVELEASSKLIDSLPATPAEETESLKEIVLRLEKKVDTLSSEVESLLSCRICLKKAYKKAGPSTMPVIESPRLPMTTGHESPRQMSIVDSFTRVQPAETKMSASADDHDCTTKGILPIPNYCKHDEKTQEVGVLEERETDADAVAAKEANRMEGNVDDRLVYLGEPRFGVKLREQDINRCIATSKTPDKLARNLLEFLLSEEEFKTSTMYGNPQHNKAAIDVEKRKALRSFIFSQYFQGALEKEKEKVWMSIVKSLNDKIRKRRVKSDL